MFLKRAVTILGLTIVVTATYSATATLAQAATVAFDPQETTVGMATPFLVGMTIDSDVPVNTIRAVIDVPDSMDILDASDGNSIINFWIERPHITDSHQLVFAGIIPGGFSGIRGKLLTLKVQAKREGTYSFILNPSSNMYANDEHATRQNIISRPLELSVVEGKDNLVNAIPDTTPPETFTPVVVNIPDGGQGSWAVSFEAQDKVSGIASYQVSESMKKITPDNTSRLMKLSWHEAKSPYILSDQQLSSYIYVKATDLKGNMRFAVVAPQHPPVWYRTTGGYILILLCILLVLYVISRRLHWKIG
jgi:hypothetical protein